MQCSIVPTPTNLIVYRVSDLLLTQRVNLLITCGGSATDIPIISSVKFAQFLSYRLIH